MYLSPPGRCPSPPGVALLPQGGALLPQGVALLPQGGALGYVTSPLQGFGARCLLHLGCCPSHPGCCPILPQGVALLPQGGALGYVTSPLQGFACDALFSPRAVPWAMLRRPCRAFRVSHRALPYSPTGRCPILPQGVALLPQGVALLPQGVALGYVTSPLQGFACQA